MLDLRGQSCPLPRLMAQKALSSHPAKLECVTDSANATQSLLELAAEQGYRCTTREQDGDTYIQMEAEA